MNVKKLLARLEQLAQMALGKELGEIPVAELPPEDADMVYRGSRLSIKQVSLPYLQSHVAEWFALGMLAHNLTWYTIAENYYRMVTAVAPAHADAWYHLGVLLDDQGRWQLAREMFVSALDVASPSWIRRAAVQKRLGSTKKGKATSPPEVIPLGLVQSNVNISPVITGDSEVPPIAQLKLLTTGETACHRCGHPLLGLPYACRYCGFNFCVDHRLPESHLCTGSFRVTVAPVTPLPATLPEIVPSLEKLSAMALNKTWIDIETDPITEGDERLLDHAAELVAFHLVGGSPLVGSFDLWFNAGKVAQRLQLASKATIFYRAALTIPNEDSANVQTSSSATIRAEVLAYLAETATTGSGADRRRAVNPWVALFRQKRNWLPERYTIGTEGF